jgi:hypothetical protein
MAKIRIKIDPLGNPTILDVTGHGKNCQEATKNFEKLLGMAKEESRALTEQYYEHGEVYEETLTIDGNGEA